MVGMIGILKCALVCAYVPLNEESNDKQDESEEVLGGMRAVSEKV